MNRLVKWLSYTTLIIFCGVGAYAGFTIYAHHTSLHNMHEALSEDHRYQSIDVKDSVLSHVAGRGEVYRMILDSHSEFLISVGHTFYQQCKAVNDFLNTCGEFSFVIDGQTHTYSVVRCLEWLDICLLQPKGSTKPIPLFDQLTASTDLIMRKQDQDRIDLNSSSDEFFKGEIELYTPSVIVSTMASRAGYSGSGITNLEGNQLSVAQGKISSFPEFADGIVSLFYRHPTLNVLGKSFHTNMSFLNPLIECLNTKRDHCAEVEMELYAVFQQDVSKIIQNLFAVESYFYGRAILALPDFSEEYVSRNNNGDIVLSFGRECPSDTQQAYSVLTYHALLVKDLFLEMKPNSEIDFSLGAIAQCAKIASPQNKLIKPFLDHISRMKQWQNTSMMGHFPIL